ncbi:ATP-binding protein [Candidatus Woesearchaeota archaeon]|nr:ATP-binding protein [Candidatus Woesearchaeota archaeon]
MIQHFINREEELNFLERKYSENHANLIVIYGKRRVGKTELVKNFLKDKKGVYFLCTRESLEENFKELKAKFSELTNKDYFKGLATNSFFDIFKYLVQEIGKEKIVIVIDEFPYLIELQKGVVSIFQKIWDELLIKTNVFLILCGSSIGMMETDVLSYKSALYGRRTGEWNVSPLKFRFLKEFFPNYKIEDLIKIWAVCGGTPFYLAKMNPKLSVEENIKQNILRKGEVLYNDPKVLLREEFREPRIYTLILKYLSLGYNTFGKLSSVTGIEKGNLSKYIATLEETRIIKHELPLGQRKRGFYAINDQFFNFWFRFVYPNLSDLEMGRVKEVFAKISKSLNSYYGYSFENLMLELIKLKELPLGANFEEVRKWWFKDKEIDIIALNEEKKQILFGECKWRGNVNAERIVKQLAEKAGFVQWQNVERKESFAVFAKSFKKRVKSFEGKPVYCFDLKDLERIFKLRKRKL